MTDNIVSVSQLNEYANNLIKSDYILNNLFVLGEISNLNKHYSGHIYFTLKDESASIKTVMFKGNAEKLNFELKNGLTILCAGKVNLYEKDGVYQLYVNQIIPQGQGSLNLAYEQLCEKLRLQGIFEESHKLAIPQFPENIAVVTSPTGAAVQDILNVLRRRYPICNVVMCPVKVQGVGAAEEIIEALKLINVKSCADLIILGRGGGSIEELWAFNDESLANTIYNSKIPIISGVGHETDFTICDFAADLRAPTPSAAAELATPDIMEISATLEQYNKVINKEIDNRLFKIKSQCSFYLTNHVFVNFSDIINKKREKILNYDNAMSKTVNNRLHFIKQNNENLLQRINSLSVSSILSRGFAVIKKDDIFIKSIKQLNSGDEVTLLLNDGEISANIK